ncbi:MAG: orotate phosphoribosyltransferase [Proteobacteria bacterium]|nr:orotate phosphoribosyltransferase [Pseudomonadota bacterium]
MTEDEVLSEFRASEALLEGHFKLSSGRHSSHYLQCAKVLMDPMRASRLAAALTAKLPRDLRQQIAKVVSPAMGGVIIGHEMGRSLGVEAIFVERPTGTFEFRRGRGGGAGRPFGRRGRFRRAVLCARRTRDSFLRRRRIAARTRRDPGREAGQPEGLTGATQ